MCLGHEDIFHHGSHFPSYTERTDPRALTVSSHLIVKIHTSSMNENGQYHAIIHQFLSLHMFFVVDIRKSRQIFLPGANKCQEVADCININQGKRQPHQFNIVTVVSIFAIYATSLYL